MTRGPHRTVSSIGVDFDNTIVSYDDLMHTSAVERGWIKADVQKSKRIIRDSIRQMPDGEVKWQRLQALVYGAGMAEAQLIPGVQTFFKRCKQCRVRVCIISHRTEYANFDESRTNLRTAAANWMKQNRFFVADGLCVSPEDVYFEVTRRDKVERLKNLGCTHFIDDLEEVFLDASFPTNVEKILYAPYEQNSLLPGVKVAKTWKEISEYFFDARN